jgi:hypothetical protein
VLDDYPIGGKLRYFRLADPMDRIYHFRVLSNGQPVDITDAHGNNMQAHYRKHPTRVLKSGVVTVPENRRGGFLAVAVEGEHGDECVTCCAMVDGRLVGPVKRAPDFKANNWEHRVAPAPKNCTFYLPLPEDHRDKQVEVFVSFSRGGTTQIPCNVYLCQKH